MNPYLANAGDLSRQDTTAQHSLGEMNTLGAVGEDTVLFYVDSSGDLVGDAQYEAASTDVAVYQYADTGPLTWVYVRAGAAIDRGEIVMSNTNTAPRVVKPSTGAISPAAVIGVAACNIAKDSYGWIVRQGAVLALDAGISANEGAIPSSTAGKVTKVAAVTGAAFGWCLVDNDPAAGTARLQVACAG